MAGVKIAFVGALLGVIGFAGYMAYVDRFDAKHFLATLLVCGGLILVILADNLQSLKVLFGREGAEISVQTRERLEADVTTELATRFGVLLAHEILDANRYVGDDHITDMTRKVVRIISLLREVGGDEATVLEIEKMTVPYVRNDLRHRVTSAVLQAVQTIQDVEQRPISNNVDFHDRFMESYRIGQTGQRVLAMLREAGATDPDDVGDTFDRLDAFLVHGTLETKSGEPVYTFSVPRG